MRPWFPKQSSAGFSLLELIGVLAVISVLAAMVLPLLTLSIDKAVYDRETADLTAFESALERSIKRLGIITNASKLGEQIALELGVQASAVATNGRGQPRFFVIDPQWQIGVSGSALPYAQTDAGSRVTDASGALIPPVNPRLMIVTSLGERLTGLFTGTPAVAGDFQAIWDAPAGTVPAATVFAGWRGKPGDLRIRRINLSPIFVRLLLSQNQAPNQARYSLGGAAFADSTPLGGSGADAYFIRNSALLLYDHTGLLDSKQVLTRDRSFVYDRNVWRGQIEANASIEGMDIRAVANQFLDAFSNANAAADSGQTNVLLAMMNYFDAYRSWAEPPSSFANNALKLAARSAQSNLLSVVQGLYEFPGHPPFETPCP